MLILGCRQPDLANYNIYGNANTAPYIPTNPSDSIRDCPST